MTETRITEGIVGIISAGFFLWLFPIASDMQKLVSAYYATNIPNTPLIVSTATLVFCIGLFGLIAIYCLGACLEKIILWYLRSKK